MAKDTITGVVIRGGRLEWATLVRGTVVDSGTAPLRAAAGRLEEAPAPETPDQPPVQVASGIGSAAPRPEPGTEAGELALKGRIVLGLDPERMLLRIVDVPEVDAEELDSMIGLQADKLSPFPTDRAVISHEIVGRREGTCRVLIALAEEDVVQADGARLSEVGVVPAAVDSAMLGRFEWLRSEGHIGEDGRHLVLVVAGPVPELFVAEDGAPIALRSLGRRTDETSSEFIEETAREIAHTLMSLELERGGASVNRVSIWHAGEEGRDLAERVRRECGCDVTLEDAAGLASVAETVARRAVLAGRLDLTPAAWRSDRSRRASRRRLLRVGSGILGVWLAGIAVILGMLTYEDRSVARLEAQCEAVAGPAMEVRGLRSRVSMIKQYMDRRDSPLECLREVSLCLPSGVDVTWFTYRKRETLKLKGQAQTSEQVLDFKRKLDASELFGDVTLVSMSRDRRRGKEVFEMDLALPKGGA